MVEAIASIQLSRLKFVSYFCPSFVGRRSAEVSTDVRVASRLAHAAVQSPDVGLRLTRTAARKNTSFAGVARECNEVLYFRLIIDRSIFLNIVRWCTKCWDFFAISALFLLGVKIKLNQPKKWGKIYFLYNRLGKKSLVCLLDGDKF